MCVEVTQQPHCGACGQIAAKIEGLVHRCWYAERGYNTAICQYSDEDCRDVEVPWTDVCAHDPPFGGRQPTTMEQTYCILILMQRYFGPEDFRRQSEIAALEWGEDWLEQIQDALMQERGLAQNQMLAEQEGESNNRSSGGHRNSVVDDQSDGVHSLGLDALKNIGNYDL